METVQITNQFEFIFGVTPSDCSLRHLEQIAECFSLIPYENLTKIIQSACVVNIDERLRKPHQVLDGYYRWKTGGTCFSLTYCLQAILTSYRYQCAPRMADLGNSRNNHCALVVTFGDTQYLLDPGYLITTPLPIPESGNVLHPTRLFPVRLHRDTIGGFLHLSTLEPSGEKYRYRLQPHDCLPEAFQAYWKDSFSWTMMNSLLITRFIHGGGCYVHDRYVRRFSRDGKKNEKVKAEFDTSIAELTGIHRDIIRQAREIISEIKHGLKE